MRKTLIVLLSVLALVLGFTTIASAAGKPAYKVSLTAPKSSTAGKFLIVSGKVTGPKAAGKTVTVQRKYAGGKWVNVAFAVIKKNGKFSARVETPQGGTTSFRALKGKSSVRKAGVSPVRALPVYKWLNLDHEPASSYGNDFHSGFSRTIGGKTYHHSFLFYDGDSTVQFKLGGQCTQFTTRAAYDVTNGPQPVDAFVLGIRTFNGGNPPTVKEANITSLQNATVSRGVKGAAVLSIDLDSLNSDPYFAVLGEPKVYCNAEHLPNWVPGDLV